jgi:uncharacterized protein YuzE
MHATFAPGTDVAYVYLTDASDGRAVNHTEPLIIDLPGGTRALINLDFDAEGRLIGIEVDGARQGLPASLLTGADTQRGA